MLTLLIYPVVGGVGHDHQQYLIKNPFGYRCHSATGIKVPSA